MSSYEYGRRGRRPPTAASAQAQPVVPAASPEEGLEAPTIALPAVSPAQIVVQRADAATLGDPRLILLREPDSERAAAYRVLRHRLDDRACRVVCVTSPGPRQGATTLAINLALALGECGRARVALLEVNLRSPSLAAMLGIQAPVCFGDQLAAHRARASDPWFAIEALSPHLHLGVVRPDRSGQPLLDSAPFSLVAEHFRRAGYDYVLFDTAAVLGAADVNLVQEGVDGVLVATTKRLTRARELRRAVEQIDRKKLLGVVLVG